MHKALQYLIVIGCVVWVLLMMEERNMGIALSDVWPFSARVSDTTKDARCEKYAHDVEGDRALGYGDRFAQFTDGCW
jgi:hypothetical protein